MYSYAEDYYYTLFAYLIIPFYVQLEQRGQGLHNHVHTDFEAQSQEEIDRLCKQEIDNLFTTENDEPMPDSPLFNRLREKERSGLHGSYNGVHQPSASWKKYDTKTDPEYVFCVDGWTDEEVGMWKAGYGFCNPKETYGMPGRHISHGRHGWIDFGFIHDAEQASFEADSSIGVDLKDEGPPPYFCDLFKFLDEDECVCMWKHRKEHNGKRRRSQFIYLCYS